MSGNVRMGTTQDSLVATSIGQKIAIGTYIETGPGSYAYIIWPMVVKYELKKIFDSN